MKSVTVLELDLHMYRGPEEMELEAGTCFLMLNTVHVVRTHIDDMVSLHHQIVTSGTHSAGDLENVFR